jgi:hypothetical protein
MGHGTGTKPGNAPLDSDFENAFAHQQHLLENVLAGRVQRFAGGQFRLVQVNREALCVSPLRIWRIVTGPLFCTGRSSWRKAPEGSSLLSAEVWPPRARETGKAPLFSPWHT